MAELLSNMTLEQVILVLIAVGGFSFGLFKGYLFIKDFLDKWATNKVIQENIYSRVDEVEKNNEEQWKKINLLIESDKERNKGEILKQCYYFEKKGCISTYELEYVEKLFKVYTDEGGNSFISHDIMPRVRKIPLEK